MLMVWQRERCERHRRNVDLLSCRGWIRQSVGSRRPTLDLGSSATRDSPAEWKNVKAHRTRESCLSLHGMGNVIGVEHHCWRMCVNVWPVIEVFMPISAVRPDVRV